MAKECVLDRSVARGERLLDFFGEALHLDRQLLAGGKTNVRVRLRGAPGGGDARRDDRQDGAADKKYQASGQKTDLENRHGHGNRPLGAPCPCF